MKISIIIPAHNEEGCIANTVKELHQVLTQENIEHEIIVINDNSTDATGRILEDLSKTIPTLRGIQNTPPHGFGFAVRAGLNAFTGDAVAIYMADASDSPTDLVRFIRAMTTTGADCIFGSRFIKGSKVIDYPFPKLILNRLANFFIQIMFRIQYNDVTNAFKLYKKHVILGIAPILSHHFNLTVELPLKSIVRGYRYKVLPNQWTNRKAGVSKLKIAEMGSRYLFICLYCLIEQLFSRGDYKKKELPTIQEPKQIKAFEQ